MLQTKLALMDKSNLQNKKIYGACKNKQMQAQRDKS